MSTFWWGPQVRKRKQVASNHGACRPVYPGRANRRPVGDRQPSVRQPSKGRRLARGGDTTSPGGCCSVSDHVRPARKARNISAVSRGRRRSMVRKCNCQPSLEQMAPHGTNARVLVSTTCVGNTATRLGRSAADTSSMGGPRPASSAGTFLPRRDEKRENPVVQRRQTVCRQHDEQADCHAAKCAAAPYTSWQSGHPAGPIRGGYVVDGWSQGGPVNSKFFAPEGHAILVWRSIERCKVPEGRQNLRDALTRRS